MEYDKINKKLIEETDEKFAGRVLSLLFYTCGCDNERAKRVLLKCIKKLNKKLKNSQIN